VNNDGLASPASGASPSSGSARQATIDRCAACDVKRLHTPEDWKNHPFAGHGFTREQGWTHPDLSPMSSALKPTRSAISGEAKA
jgi:hypothetical protein